MQELEDIKSLALFVLYPDGEIEKEYIDDEKLLHMNYYIDLARKDSRFKKVLEENNIRLLDRKNRPANLLTYELDNKLAELGIIVFHNLNIYEIQQDRDFIDYGFFEFFISVPNNMSEEQKDIMTELEDTYDMSYNFYGKPNGEEIIDVSYEEAKEIYYKGKRK